MKVTEEQLLAEALKAVGKAEVSVAVFKAATRGECLYLAALQAGGYIPADRCHCSRCEFVSDVWSLEQEIAQDGELPDGWESLGT